MELSAPPGDRADAAPAASGPERRGHGHRLESAQRLHGRYRRLLARGKVKQHVVTAIARELLGFIWAIGFAVEGQQQPDGRAA